MFYPWQKTRERWLRIPVTVQSFIDPSGYEFTEGYEGNFFGLMYDMIVNARSIAGPKTPMEVTVYGHISPLGIPIPRRKRMLGREVLEDMEKYVTESSAWQLAVLDILQVEGVIPYQYVQDLADSRKL